LSREPGVASVCVDVQRKRVEVSYDSTTSSGRALSDSLARAGYPASGPPEETVRAAEAAAK
jgi:copper chaperone CopZ